MWRTWKPRKWRGSPSKATEKSRLSKGEDETLLASTLSGPASPGMVRALNEALELESLFRSPDKIIPFVLPANEPNGEMDALSWCSTLEGRPYPTEVIFSFSNDSLRDDLTLESGDVFNGIERNESLPSMKQSATMRSDEQTLLAAFDDQTLIGAIESPPCVRRERVKELETNEESEPYVGDGKGVSNANKTHANEESEPYFGDGKGSSNNKTHDIRGTSWFACW
jgi:hypothetical protein